METGWRLHLTNRTIQHLDILPGKPSLLGAWIRRDRVSYYDLENGASAGEARFEPLGIDNRAGLDWQNFINSLSAPNGATLPLFRTPQAVLRLTHDKHYRLFRASATDLYLQTNNIETRLEITKASTFLDVELDSTAGITCALDQDGRLHIYRQHTWVGAFEMGLSVDENMRPLLAVARDGHAIFVTDRQRIVLADVEGSVKKQHKTGETIGRFACSPDGRWLITSDLEIGVIRVYDGATLTQTHQRFAIDLLEEARQLQLIADVPPTTLALSTLSISDAGIVAFAISGVICVCSIHHQFQKVPK